MEQNIVIDKKIAVYIKNAANAFEQYHNAFVNERNNCDESKIAKERYYCKVIFFGNLDRILDSINTVKKDEFAILMRIVNFILQTNYHVVFPYDKCGWPATPRIETTDLYSDDGHFPSNRSEFLCRVKDNIIRYNRIISHPKIADYIGKKF